MDQSTPGLPVPHYPPEVAQSCQWCQPTISSSVIPFFSYLQSFPATGSFLMNWLYALVGQSIGASVKHQSFQWVFRIDFLLDWPVWTPCSPRNSQESSPISSVQLLNRVQLFATHGMKHTRLPCPSPSPTPRVTLMPCPLSQWCHPIISSSAVPFSSCCQSFPASGSFQMNQFFTSHGQILEFQPQHQSFQWIFRTDFL